MLFSALALSTLAAQAAARAVPVRASRDVDYTSIDYSNVDYSNVDWSKVDYGFGDKNTEHKDTVVNTPQPSNDEVTVEVDTTHHETTTTTKTETEDETESQPEAPATTTTVKEVTSKPAPQPTKPATQPSTGNGNLSADQESALAAHNSARTAVNNAALEWDDSLASDAQAWADNIAGLGTLQHSSGSGQGENLYMQSGSDSPYTNAINAFLSEKSSYSGQKIDGSNFSVFGHYTQAIWKSTTKVGMAVAKSADGASYVVCRYSPPGNYIGELPF